MENSRELTNKKLSEKIFEIYFLFYNCINGLNQFVSRNSSKSKSKESLIEHSKYLKITGYYKAEACDLH